MLMNRSWLRKLLATEIKFRQISYLADSSQKRALGSHLSLLSYEYLIDLIDVFIMDV